MSNSNTPIKSTRAKTLYMVQLALLTAICLILNFTPLGFLRIGVVEISFMAIPVIIGGAVLGPLAGAFLGLVFGICSLSLAPTHALFGVAFSSNPVLVAAVCIVPRVCIGLVAAYIVLFTEKFNKFQKLSYFVAGLLGALTNTVLFLAGVVILLGQMITPKMTELGLLSAKTLTGFWIGIGITNGIPEAIVSTFVSGIVIVALKKIVVKTI